MITRHLVTAMVVIILSLLFPDPINEHDNEIQPPVDYSTISCGPGGIKDIDSSATGKFIRVMPGWGNHTFKIATSSDSTAIYFNQGITMYYSYHMREAVASFREAARFDSTSVMPYWGQALALGPTYNFGRYYKTPPTVAGTIKKMNAVKTVSEKEHDLVKAMNTRYDIEDTTTSRKVLNAAWTTSLKKLMQKYPDDDEIKALYVDAVMLEHSWDFWYNDGTPKAWTPEVVKLCEEILKKNEHHPAALHYYIHVTEASREPQVALPAADKLKIDFPGIAHMVHMSSHEYERNGLFADGVTVNEKSDEALGIYDSLAGNLSLARHVPHYYAVEAYCALSGNMYKKGMPKTFKCRDIVAPSHELTYDQYLYMFPQLARVRMGKWSEILEDTTQIDKEWTYATIINDFARGMAHTHFGNTKKALRHLNNIVKNKAHKILTVADLPDNAPLSSVLVAEETLRSFIYFRNRNYDSAVASINRGILVEDSLIYAEPKDWLLPARQYLGYYMLAAGRLNDAEQVYKDDLIWNPGNGWSAIGLYQTLVRQKKFNEAERLKPIYKRSFSEADELPPASVYK